MGANLSASFNAVNQNSINNVYQRSSSECNADCTNKISNVNVNITDGSDVGNVTFTQECSAQALCTLRSDLKTVAAQQLKSRQAGSADTTCWALFCANASSNITNQVMENTTTQIITNTCNATSENLLTDVNVLISGSTVGDVAFDQTSQGAVANCSISNSASASINQSAESTQTASGSISVFVVIIIAIVIIIVISGAGLLNRANQRKYLRQEQIRNQNLINVITGTKQ